MRLLSPAVAAALLALGAPALAGVDDAVHKKCLEAQDYRGCVEVLSERAENKSTDQLLSKDEQLKIDYLKLKEMSKAFPCPASQFIASKLPETPPSELKSLCRDFARMPIKKGVKNKISLRSVYGIHKSFSFSRFTVKDRNLTKDFDQWLWDNYSIGENGSQNKQESRKKLLKAIKTTNEYIGSDEYKSDMAHIARQHQQAETGSNQCPTGTSMVTIDNRWNFLFFRGGKVKEIGCMSPQQLASFNAQIELGNQEASRRIWRDAVNNMAADRRNQQLIDAVNQPVYCNTNSTTTGSIYGSGYGSADLYGSTSSSTSCY